MDQDAGRGSPPDDDATEPTFDVDVVAAALRWTIGRSPRHADEASDRRLLRALAARLGPDVEPTPTALDAHLAALLAAIAARGELSDHVAPRHRSWINDLGRVYLCAPADLPAELRERIGSETVLAHLDDSVSNRARAAARLIGVDPNSVRVRREPQILDAAASALVVRLHPPRPTGGAAAPAAPPPAAPPPVAPRRRVAAIAAGAVTILVLVGLLLARSGDDRADETPATATATAPVVPLAAVGEPVVALGLADGSLVAVTRGAVVPLGLDDVVAVDAVHHDGTVHVVAEQRSGHLAYGAVTTREGRWVDLDTGGRGAEIGVDRAGRAVVVAIAGAQGDLVRRVVDDGVPGRGWEPLAATGAVDIDMVANRDGRLEVGGVTTTGAAFNIWQTGAPGGWSNYSDTRAGEDGRRIQAVANVDGRLELFVERGDGTLWNTWQEAPGRSWLPDWDPRYLEDLRQWRVVVGAEGRLVAVGLTDEAVLLRRQVPVPQADGTTRLMWSPSTVIEELDPLAGPLPDTVTAVAADEGVVVVASGAGRTVVVPVGLDGPAPPRPVATAGVDTLVPVDG